jgi:hypothetical protein
MIGHGEKLTRKQEAAIAALLTESTIAAAALKTDIGEATLQRWLKLPAFDRAYRDARRQLVHDAVGRLQGAVGDAVDTLRSIAKDGKKESDRVRASVALLDQAFRGIEPPDVNPDPVDKLPVAGTADVVRLLAERLAQLNAADLPTPEKAKLTATLADAMLRAIGVDIIDKRLEAIQTVLKARKNDGAKP